MSMTSDIINLIVTNIEAVTGVENVYGRRVAYADSKAFVEKFQNAAKDRYIGFMVYRSGKSSEITSFLNKIRHTYQFTVLGLIGAEETENEFSYDVLRDLLEDIQYAMNTNLQLGGNVTDSELAEIGDIDLDTAVGKTFWTGAITQIIYKDVIEGSIS